MKLKPCASPGCPALATRGARCPVHADAIRLLDGEWPATPEDTAAAIAKRDAIGAFYARQRKKDHDGI